MLSLSSDIEMGLYDVCWQRLVSNCFSGSRLSVLCIYSYIQICIYVYIYIYMYIYRYILYARTTGREAAPTRQVLMILDTCVQITMWWTVGKYCRCDVSRLPFQTKSLDGVHAGAALHCWSKLEESLSEVFRVLKPGKGFFATTFLT